MNQSTRGLRTPPLRGSATSPDAERTAARNMFPSRQRSEPAAKAPRAHLGEGSFRRPGSVSFRIPLPNQGGGGRSTSMVDTGSGGVNTPETAESSRSGGRTTRRRGARTVCIHDCSTYPASMQCPHAVQILFLSAIASCLWSGVVEFKRRKLPLFQDSTTRRCPEDVENLIRWMTLLPK